MTSHTPAPGLDSDIQHHQVATNGITLHVAEMGSGPAVLFCHGFPAIWSSWQSQMAAVAAAGFHAIALDMRGYGQSDAPAAAEAYMPFHTVGDLVGLLDHLEIPAAVIVGHDFGASISWNAAMMRPDRFTAVFGISVPFTQPGGVSFLDQLRARGMSNFYMFDQMRPEADVAWADAATTIPGVYYWTSGQAPEGQEWDPFDPARGLRRPAPEPISVIDPTYLQEAIDSFAHRLPWWAQLLPGHRSLFRVGVGGLRRCGYPAAILLPDRRPGRSQPRAPAE